MKNRLSRALPLIPVFTALFLFISIVSPVCWNQNGYQLEFALFSVLLGIVCAYCVAVFVENLPN
jgi:tryptophan-rich sensory protein